MHMTYIQNMIVSLILDINDCDPNPCDHDETCTDLLNDYNCTCHDGWTGKDCDISKLKKNPENNSSKQGIMSTGVDKIMQNFYVLGWEDE